MNYYNENDLKAAAWLNELIASGLLPMGYVDTRSIVEVQPDDLIGFTQCHFFAGIGGWPLALQLAGWPETEPVWTGSCPCQPFSCAGKQKGVEDERHLWPEYWRLIGYGNPPVLFGEQVASPAGRDWLDNVSDDLEALGYEVGSADLCAAGAGSPNIRSRLWFVADAAVDRRREGSANTIGSGSGSRTQGSSGRTAECSESGRMGDTDHPRSQGRGIRRNSASKCAAGTAGVAGGLADTEGSRCGTGVDRSEDEPKRQIEIAGENERMRQSVMCDSGGVSGMARRTGRDGRGLAPEPCAGPALTNGFWRDAGWVLCRPERRGGDPCWRPVEPGTFPLADGVPGRAGLLRGYGNAINPHVAAGFIEAYCEARNIVFDNLDFIR